MDNTNTTYTETLPPEKLLRILVLQRRNDALLSIEEYLQRRNAQAQAPGHFVCSSVQSLFFDLEASIERTDKKRYQEIEKLVVTRNPKDAIKAFRIMNRYLDEKGVTRFDNKKRIDTTRIEEENSAMGLH